ncbi:fluoride efflux transporter CrcB [Gracilimonas mengyeensis]|uniref:Fluoride-specific ion channel FluC n=1 Tax=Gracilimonas mengyeensis TaxID=1302730 RepID=A0A521FJW6_9BACT|nr:fluoride efflux transporter CrcB [Gracilimonas mengyeensis]SMO96512.1 camphor resistance protein CrcB [Gracilimonas mengyeensis]
MQTDWLKILAVGSGGFIGATGRYLISLFAQSQFPGSTYPYGTTAANLLGCLFIGLLAGLFQLKSWGHPELRLFIFVGMLGGFTTFSTFSHETFLLWENGKLLMSLFNLGFQVFFGLIFVWLGYQLVRLVG